VNALEVSQWTNWCLHSCCEPMSNIFDVAPGNRLESDLHSPDWGDCVSIICSSGIEEEDDNREKWEVLRTIQLASRQNGISSNQHVPYAQDESCWVWMQVAWVSHHLAICNKSVRCCLLVYRDKLWCATAEIAWLSDITRTLFEGKDVCWCLSQMIPGILHETDANYQVML